MAPTWLAAQIKEPIGRIGGGFMMSREAKAICAEFGTEPRPTYFRGRCGVLGDVDADIVTAACVFFPPEHVRDSWEKARKVPVELAVERYAAACHAWSERHFGAFPAATRLAELLEAVTSQADVSGVPLFAGWRAVPLPSDPVARTGQLLHLMRELRGGLHGIAVLSNALSPLVATLAGEFSGAPFSTGFPDGHRAAQFNAWPEPYPEPSEDEEERRRAAEEVTDELMAIPLDVLRDAEAVELETLLKDLLAFVR